MQNSKSPLITIVVLLKAIVSGIVAAETWFFVKAFRLSFVLLILHFRLQEPSIVLISIGLLSLAIFIVYGQFFSDVVNIVRSARLDIFISFALGVAVSAELAGIGNEYYLRLASKIDPPQLAAMLAVICGIGLSLLVRQITLLLRKPESRSAFFVSDDALDSSSDDLLNLSDEAERFAERILNQGCERSLVFGVDAPWGIGKSTFINFCKEYWRKKYKETIVVYDFSPIAYEGKANLREIFIDGLIRALQRGAFIPEAKPLISRYARFIRGAKTKLSIFDIEILSDAYSIDDAMEDLESVLRESKRRILVIVDDLDRLTFQSIREVLFAVKKSFTLPNISYVLLYDSENIGIMERQARSPEKISEFLEKFVAVKVSLYLDSSTLAKYVSRNLSTALSGNSQADPQLVSKAMAGLQQIYKSDDYPQYARFLWDIRKLKRLVNTVLLLDIERTDFDNSDFNSEDLIHLLLIYINYPNLFRDIYVSETDSRMGTFSLVGPGDFGFPEEMQHPSRPRMSTVSVFRNSSRYRGVMRKLRGGKKVLVNKVFEATTRLASPDIDKVPEDIKHSYACFNGGGGTARNLEQYLKLIVRVAKPQKEETYRFYSNCKEELKRGTAIEEILKKDEFAPSKGERPHIQLWRVIVNSASEFDTANSTNAIRFLARNISRYSLFEDEGVGIGLRDTLPFYLAKLLDVTGWPGVNNSDENVAKIADWIFGEGAHVGDGIISTLGCESLGVLGLEDALKFRLSCSADRGGDLFNLQRGLARHRNPNAPTTGPTTQIAIAGMREISQEIYRLFHRQYIAPQKNIFAEIDNLGLADFTGAYFEYVKERIASSDITDVEVRIEALRSRLKAFIVYQLGSQNIGMGIGCGYYDPEGERDEKGIASCINEYLFSVCFDPTVSEGNTFHFLDFLIRSLLNRFPRSEDLENVSPAELIGILDPAQVSSYWVANRPRIKAQPQNYSDTVRTVTVPTIRGGARVASVTYRYALPTIYAVLDNLVAGDNHQTP